MSAIFGGLLTNILPLILNLLISLLFSGTGTTAV